jgi:hypothetical protein
MNILLKPRQYEVFINGRRFRILVAGRRFGKTYLAIIELIQAAWGRGRVVWYVAPTYKQAKRVVWNMLKQLTRPYWASKPNETNLTIELRSGGTIALRGADNYDSLRGDGLDFVVLDEYASMRPEAWSEVLRPSLSDREGSALFIGTPNGLNHFYDLFQESQGRPDWSTFQFTTEQGGNVSGAELESAAGELDEKTYRQEFEASFENLGQGRVYYAFDRSENVKPVTHQMNQPFCWTLDFNVNPMCSLIAQIGDQTMNSDRGNASRSLRVLDEIVLSDSNTLEACGMFVERMQALQPDGPVEVKIYGDAAGEARSTAGKSDYQIIREFFRTAPRFRTSIHVRSANPPVRDRVNTVNSLLCNSQRQRRVSIDPRCLRLIRDLERVVWKADAHGNLGAQVDKSDPELTHVSDALGYLIEREFSLRPSPRIRIL